MARSAGDDGDPYADDERRRRASEEGAIDFLSKPVDFTYQVRAGEFAFCFAHNGEKALNRLQADASIDLILLDINMPVMDGLTMLTRMHEQQMQVRAVIASAYGDMPNIRTAPAAERGSVVR